MGYSEIGKWAGMVLVICLCGCAIRPVAGSGHRVAAAADAGRYAVLPVALLSDTAAPTREIRAELARALESAGLKLFPDGELEQFMARHRIRYTGGIDSDAARAFRTEAGVAGVIVTSLELYSDQIPPRFALTARLVKTGDDPAILWMKSVALAGDDAPGLLGLGVITESRQLVARGIAQLAVSLVARLNGAPDPADTIAPFRPGITFHGALFDAAGHYRVGVVPFFNRSDRPYAGEIMALHFVEALTALPNMTVIEPGVIREQLLKNRIIMEEGISFADADLLFPGTGADYILNGTVLEYQEPHGAIGTPRVDFSALLLERRSREVVWGGKTHQAGDDRVLVFDIGRISTANALAGAMARGAVRTMVKEH